MTTILLVSPIRTPPNILTMFLHSISNIDVQGVDLSYYFADDNTEPESTHLLRSFQLRAGSKCAVIKPPAELSRSDYQRSEGTHNWTPTTVDRIIAIKNAGLAEAVAGNYDYALLVDSDLLMHPGTLRSLLSQRVDIVSGLFWTQWKPWRPHMPNVWDFQTYEYASADSIIRLRTSGKYRVGGLGAVTLISASAIKKGLSFARIENLRMWGEDRHFCVRAQCLGYQLYVDTTYPLFHIYRDQLIEEAHRWYEDGCDPALFSSWLDDAWAARIRTKFDTQDQPRASVRRLAAKGLRKLANSIEQRHS